MNSLLRKSFAAIALLMAVAVSCTGKEPTTPVTPPVDYVTSGVSTLNLPCIFSDRMVLQQNSNVKIFGTATPKVKISVSAGWTKEIYETIVPANGRWSVTIPTPAGSFNEYSMTVTDSQKGKKTIYFILIGEVWMTGGQSNMEHPMRGFGSVANGNFQPVYNADEEMAQTDIPSFRYFKVKYQLSQTPMVNTPSSTWDRCVPGKSAEFEAIAFFFGRQLSRKLNVPIGIIGCAYGGTRIESWMAPESFYKFDPADYKDASELDGNPLHKSAPSNIYNGMVLPVIDYTYRGWLWYQGESNRDNSFAYSRLLQEMVRSWRAYKKDTDNSLPFYIVQLAPFKASDDVSGADVRAAQMDAYENIHNSGIVCASDVGDYSTIHYPKKQQPSERLALWALYNQYSDKSINPMGPRFASMTREGSSLVVSLTDAEGLVIKSACDFAFVAGSDGQYQKATVTKGESNTLVFSAPGVTLPQSVKYCYSTWHVGTIFNGAGLPLFPFKETLKQ